MRKGLRFVGWVITIFTLSVVALVFLGFGYTYLARWVQNPKYAADYFEELFPYSEVLATKRWHAIGDEAWDCTFAVVSIPADSPELPNDRFGTELGWQFRWGGNWQTAPAAPLGDNIRDAIGFCTTRLPDGLGQRIQDALNSTGGYYARDRVGETVYLYAPAHGLAARIRYGD